MSSRPHAALQQWVQIRRSLVQTFITPNLSANRHARSFNNSSVLSAKPRKSPTFGYGTPVRRRRMQVDQSGILLQSLAFRGPVEEPLAMHEKRALYAYEAALAIDVLPKRLSFQTYKDVGKHLITAAWSLKPNASIIRSISSDVETIYQIGFLISRDDRDLWAWIFTACALAKSPSAVCFAVTNMMRNNLPLHPSIFPEFERLVEEGYPSALCLRAKMYINRGQYETACTLLETRVLPFINPTPRRPPLHRDVTFHKVIESPWRLYALANASWAETVKSEERRVELQTTADDAIKTAAMEYNDPEAFINYASLMLNENNLDAYEESMAKAAAAGSSEACLFLANFYYYTYHGRFPIRGERDQGATKPPLFESTSFVGSMLGIVSFFFNRYARREEYRQFAADWYHLANLHGEPVAVFMCALLKREDGKDIDGRIFLEYSSKQKKQDKNLDEVLRRMDDLKLNWFKKEYTPKIPKGFLKLR